MAASGKKTVLSLGMPSARAVVGVRSHGIPSGRIALPRGLPEVFFGGAGGMKGLHLINRRLAQPERIARDLPSGRAAARNAVLNEAEIKAQRMGTLA